MRLLLLTLLSTVAIAQEPAGADDLPRLRELVAAWPAGQTVLVVAIVDGREPTILCHGTCTDNAPADPYALMPVGNLARILIADAAVIARGGKLDEPSGHELGGKALTLAHLLGGTRLLPAYFDWRADSPAVRATDLLAAANVARDANFDPEWNGSGMAELALLETALLKGRAADWPTLLRLHLSPHVAGLDAVDAGTLAAHEPPRMTSGIARSAKPAAMRLMLSGKDFANWWSWRTRASRPHPEGDRAGGVHELDQRKKVPRWLLSDFGTTPVKTLAALYPEQRAGLICVSVGAANWIPGLDDQVTTAFEDELFGAPELPAAPLGGRFLGARAGKLARGPLADWVGTTWKTPADAPLACEIVANAATENGLVVTFAGATLVSSQVRRSGERRRIVLTAADRQRGGVLWVAPAAGADRQGVMIGLLHEHGDLHSVPHLLRLVPQPK